jgi:cysteine synthase
MLSGLNGVMSLAQDLRSNNLAWHFGSFKQEIPLDQRQILIVFAIGSPGLVNGVVQAIGESAPGTTIIPVTHSHPKARSAYVVLFAPLFPSEIADSPFCTAAWVDLENFS